MTSAGYTTADEWGHALAMRLRRAHAHLRRHSNQVFAPFGMTTDQYVLLTVLAREGQATQQELVRHCHSDTATVGAMLSLLEAQQLVMRAPDPTDGRAWRVALTAAGRALQGRMRRRSAALRANLAGLFKAHELQALLGYLDRLAGALPPPGRRPPPATRGRTPPGRGRRPRATPPRNPTAGQQSPAALRRSNHE